ncbi:MAG: ABC transporter permease [Bacteroidota bacterium]
MNSDKPNKYLLQFFRWFCHPDYVEDIEGDLHEKYEQIALEKDKRKANWHFFWMVLSLFRPSLMRPIAIHNHLIHPSMFQQNLKIGYRSLWKNKGYSAIKIGGFAIGIAAFLLILLFVQDELSYDQHYVDKDRLYRLLNVENGIGDFDSWTAFPAQIGQLLNEDFPEIELAGRLIPYDWHLAGDNLVSSENYRQRNYEKGFAYADASLLEVLSIPMVYGNRKTALAKPNTIVLSKKMADKYFPDQDPVGKDLIINGVDDYPFIVGGVMEDFPSNSHLQFDFFLTLTDIEFWPGEQTNWCCSNYNAYLKVRPDTDIVALEKKLLAIRDNYVVPHLRREKNTYADKAAKDLFYELQPIQDIHLKSAGIGDYFAHSDLKMVRLFGLIAIFILLLAGINFINLFTAKSANRAKEVGVRKVVGSFRSNLIQQFLTESILFSTISVVLGTVLAWVGLPYFNQLAGKALTLPWQDVRFIPLLVGLSLLIGFLAGLYPAFYLSAFKPITVLKGKLRQGSKNTTLRNSMVIFQFATSIVLVISALVVYQQMQFILTKELGFDKERVIMIQGANTLNDKLPIFKEELRRLATVESATSSHYLPVSGTKRDQNSFWNAGRKELDEDLGTQFWAIDEHYLSTMKMQLAAGRSFSKDIASDSAAVIINQTMAKKLGLKDPVGKQIENWRTWNIIGVVEDFHFESMKGGIGALAFRYRSNTGSIVSARISGQDVNQSIASIQTIWDQMMPNQPLRYTFLDESYTRMYESVQQTGNVFATCAGLAILIACLGLFGLSTFMAEQRSKEISIRKVLGASMTNLFQLLTVNYVKLVAVAMLIGGPIAWYLMQAWLQDYTYKIALSWQFFVVAGLLVIGIALLTVSQQALKLAFSNPTEFLKGE